MSLYGLTEPQIFKMPTVMVCFVVAISSVITTHVMHLWLLHWRRGALEECGSNLTTNPTYFLMYSWYCARV